MTTTLQDIELDQIKPHPSNIRRDVGSVSELAASIKAQGLLEPLIVAASELDGSYTLIAGHRRLEAARKARLKVAPCLVHDAMSDAEALELMLVENLQRVDLSPVEEGKAYQTLLQIDGIDVDHIRKATGRAASTIRKRVGLMGLPEPTLDRIHTGQISLADAATLAEFADDPETLDRLTKELGGYNFKYTLTAARTRRKAMAAAVEAGAVVVTSMAQLYEEYPEHTERQPHGSKPAAGLVLVYPSSQYSTPYFFAVPAEPEPDPDQGDDEEEDDDGQPPAPADHAVTGIGIISSIRDVVNDDAEPRGNPNAGGSMVDARKAKEAREAADQRREQVKIAEATRIDFLRAELEEKRLRPAALVNGLRSAFWYIGSELLGTMVRLLQLPKPDDIPSFIHQASNPDAWIWHLDPDTAAEIGQPVTDQLDVEKLVLLLTAATHHDQADVALDGYVRGFSGLDDNDLRAGVRYFDFLISLGYELNEVDEQQLAAIEAEIATRDNQAAADEDDADA